MLIGKTLLERYKITEKLGEGGFGDTYLALDLALPGNPTCVVKHLQPKNPNPKLFPIAKKLFDREAEFLYRLSKHEQIPTLYAHFCEGNEFYLVEEFIEGKELSQELIANQPLNSQQTIKLLQEILEVLAVVHEQNAIHRDIKPENIIRRKQDGKLVLIDFGAVKEVTALTSTMGGKTSLTVSIGSLGYMPSEQAMGKPQLASDVYAVGMIGIEALTGLKPCQFPEDPQTKEIMWRDQLQIDETVAGILTKMVNPYCGDRYQNASEALQGIQSLTLRPSPSDNLNDLALVPQSPLQKSAKLSWRAIIVGLVVVALAGTAIFRKTLFPYLFPTSQTVTATLTVQGEIQQDDPWIRGRKEINQWAKPMYRIWFDSNGNPDDGGWDNGYGSYQAHLWLDTGKLGFHWYGADGKPDTEDDVKYWPLTKVSEDSWRDQGIEASIVNEQQSLQVSIPLEKMGNPQSLEVSFMTSPWTSSASDNLGAGADSRPAWIVISDTSKSDIYSQKDQIADNDWPSLSPELKSNFDLIQAEITISNNVQNN
jgi:serine/threonine protein kinase